MAQLYSIFDLQLLDFNNGILMLRSGVNLPEGTLELWRIDFMQIVFLARYELARVRFNSVDYTRIRK